MTAEPDADPQIRAETRERARAWRAYLEAANDARAELAGMIIKSKKAGHSFRQIREDTGLSIGTIQLDLAKAGLL